MYSKLDCVCNGNGKELNRTNLSNTAIFYYIDVRLYPDVEKALFQRRNVTLYEFSYPTNRKRKSNAAIQRCHKVMKNLCAHWDWISIFYIRLTICHTLDDHYEYNCFLRFDLVSYNPKMTFVRNFTCRFCCLEVAFPKKGKK